MPAGIVLNSAVLASSALCDFPGKTEQTLTLSIHLQALAGMGGGGPSLTEAWGDSKAAASLGSSH